MPTYVIHISTEYDCPGGTGQGCSNQGSCDDTTGICICNSGFEGASCHLSISKVVTHLFSNHLKT